MANENAASSQNFDFYGCDTTRTGTTNGNPFITIKPNNFIDGRFLSGTASDTPDVTPNSVEDDAYIGFNDDPSSGSASVEYGDNTGISGYILEDLSADES